MAMQKATMTATASSEGFLLLDSCMNPSFVNSAAAQILIYPLKVEAQANLRESLADKVRSLLFSGRPSPTVDLVPKFYSGKRLYLCRGFHLNSVAQKDSPASVAIILERGHGNSISLGEISQRFRLTGREQGVFQYLLQGLTSKEIALRMGISPNTVKAFLRLIMVKMGVSTRSGILGKALITGL
jgi:DNA-binding CsgD family transcriptional regulator